MSIARIKLTGLMTCLIIAVIGVSACRQDMHDNPKYKPYRDGAIRELPEGTVARGSLALNPPAPKVGSPAAPASPEPVAQIVPASNQAEGRASGDSASGTAAAPVPSGEEGFPFKVTKEILDRGQSRFEISCLPCHGKLGDGNGMIVLRGFRRGASYHNDRLRAAPASYFYDVITNGFGAMSSYADQLTPEDRWKVIAYIRVLQLRQNLNYAELSEADRRGVDEADRKLKQKVGSPESTHTASTRRQ